MISEYLFLLGIYLIGIMFGFLFIKKIPAGFIYATGFLWGALFWVFLAFLISILSIPYSWNAMLVAFVLLALVMLFLHISLGTWQQIRKGAWQMGIALLVFTLVVLGSYALNGMAGSPDSIYLMVMAKVIGSEGMNARWVMVSPAGFGILLPLVESASVFLKVDFLRSLMPLFAASLLAAFIFAGLFVCGILNVKRWIGVGFSIAGMLILTTTPIFFFQYYYFHTNLISSVFLFTVIISIWLFMRTGETIWLMFAILSLTGYSLSRLEAPIYSLMVLGLLLSAGKISYRQRLIIFLPYIFFITLWYIWIGMIGLHAHADILDQLSAFAIAGLNLGFGIFIVLSGLHLINNWLLPKLHYIVLILILISLVIMFIMKPEDMMTNLQSILSNMWNRGGWGGGWIAAILFLLFMGVTQIPDERIFSFSIVLFPLYILGLGSMRSSYYAGWIDSSNRMLTCIYPVIIFYLTLKWMNVTSTLTPFTDRITHHAE